MWPAPLSAPSSGNRFCNNAANATARAPPVPSGFAALRSRMKCPRRKKGARRGAWARACNAAFRKHVFPRFRSPIGSRFCMCRWAVPSGERGGDRRRNAAEDASSDEAEPQDPWSEASSAMVRPAHVGEQSAAPVSLSSSTTMPTPALGALALALPVATAGGSVGLSTAGATTAAESGHASAPVPPAASNRGVGCLLPLLGSDGAGAGWLTHPW
mmetsp:Transcript_81735/g.226390  ORF Transcript_81735/g.226390 Transcript_81735/m.226390 type:complete len:214 (-) Transcript_81735:132-773(-)